MIFLKGAAELTKVGLLDRDSDAVIDGPYRYWLHRRWDDGVGYAVFVMLNPSTADALTDDPTIRKCFGFAKAWGCKGICVVNLFAFRATDPKDVRVAMNEGRDVVGPQNHAYVTLAALAADEMAPSYGKKNGKLIAAWGAVPSAAEQARETLGWLEAATSIQPMCLDVTQSGMPRHPLYAPYSSRLKEFKLK